MQKLALSCISIFMIYGNTLNGMIDSKEGFSSRDLTSLMYYYQFLTAEEISTVNSQAEAYVILLQTEQIPNTKATADVFAKKALLLDSNIRTSLMLPKQRFDKKSQVRFYLLLLKSVTEKHLKNVYASYETYFDTLACKVENWHPKNYNQTKNYFIKTHITDFFNWKKTEQGQQDEIVALYNKIEALYNGKQAIFLCKTARAELEENFQKQIANLQNAKPNEYKSLLKKLKKITLNEIQINKGQPSRINSPTSPARKISKKARSTSRTIVYQPKIQDPETPEEAFQFKLEEEEL